MEPLHVTGAGLFLGKHSERLVVRRGKETLSEHPFLTLEQVVVSGRGVGVSSDLLEECCSRGITITFLTPAGRPYARVDSPSATATVITRREQIAAFQDRRGAALARGIAVGKLLNQANLLRYFAKYHRQRRPQLYEKLSGHAGAIQTLAAELRAMEAGTVDELRPSLLNREGRAGAHYWEAVAALLDGKAEFAGREHRGADDPVNAALNYGYGILQARVWHAVVLAGLEPHAGFIHVDRSGRPSMVLDLMEEFRQAVVDRTLLAAWGRGWSAEMEAAEEGSDSDRAFLTRECRREIGERIDQRLSSSVHYGKKRQQLRAVIQLQARHFAVAVRGEAEYTPFLLPW